MIKNRRAVFSALTLVLICLSLGNLHAQVTFDWATVGNPGNAADTTGFGEVDDVYRISKHEVTNIQYTAFLNAVADTDTNTLYSPFMDIDARGGITQSGASGSFTYAVKPGQGNNPVVFVSFFDSMRFVNWLENGQPTGAQGSGTTEDGVYTIGCTTPGVCETRAASASFFIPSENEWYKAAYHKNDGVTGNYWDYPTSTDTEPYSDNPSSLNTPDDTNTANFFKDDSTANGYDNGFAVTGSTSFDNAQNYLTDAGAYTTSLSPYGTFDQGGNAWEWNEAVIVNSSSFRGLRGGCWFSCALNFLAASDRFSNSPALENNVIGFRVASIPEPSSGLLVVLATVGLLMRRRAIRMV